MNRALLDQLTLWQEWVDSRLRELEGTVEGVKRSAKEGRSDLEERAEGLGPAIGRFSSLARTLGQVEGQMEALRETRGNLDYFVELREKEAASATDGGDLEFVTRTILDAQEDERHRTSIRIHDGPAQSLANVMMRLEFCERLALKDGHRASSELKDVRRELEEVLREVRHLIFDLRPMTLDDLGLVATLQRFAENERGRLPCDVQFRVRGQYSRFPREAETHLYRIVQEALWNSANHGHPFRVLIWLLLEADHVKLRIEDDGAGFDVATTARGRGMAEVRRRVRALGGTVRWDSAPGEGCRLEVVVPAARLGSD